MNVFKILMAFSLTLLALNSYAQKKIFLSAEVEGGILETTYQSQTNINQSIISSENNTYAAKLAISVIFEWKNRIRTEMGLAQHLQFWDLKGNKTDHELEVKQQQNYPALFLGANYRIPIFSNKAALVFGAQTSLNFVDYDVLNKQKGSDSNYVTVVTNDTDKVLLQFIPEIGLSKTFKNENELSLRFRYYTTLNGPFIKGTISHYQNNILNETISYKSEGNTFAFAVKYNFKLKR